MSLEGPTDWCIFRLINQHYGIEVSEVQEVLLCPQTTHVPLAHPAIRGLLNLRGRLVTAIDLRRRLGLPPDLKPALETAIVVHTTDGPMALIVDEVEEVLTVAPNQALSPPPHLAPCVRDLLKGMFSLDRQRLMLGLDVRRTIHLPSARSIDSNPRST